MKYAVVATLFALAAAQTAEDIPECARTCLDDAVKNGTSCSTSDFACICPHVTELSGSASGCVITKCGADVAVGKVLPAVQALCAAQGTATASTGSSASATSTTPSSGSGSGSSSSSASATSATLPVTSSVPVTTSWTSIPCDTTLVPQTPTNNQTTPTTVPIAGAAGLSVGAAAVVLAVLAL